MRAVTLDLLRCVEAGRIADTKIKTNNNATIVLRDLSIAVPQEEKNE